MVVCTDKRDGRVTVGIDLGDRTSHCCVIGDDGEILEEFSLPTTQPAFRRRFAGSEGMVVVLEAGLHSPWVSRLLGELGHEVIVANPRRLRLIYGSDSKNDQADATYLARVGRLDSSLLGPLSHRSVGNQCDRALIRSREALVRTRATLINHTRGLVKSFGERLPRCSTRAFAKKAEPVLPEALRSALGPVLGIISALSAEIRELDHRIEDLAQKSYPETSLLSQVPGVGSLTALAYALTIEDPARFPRPRSVGSYLGLRPRQADSGQLKPQLHITKAGDQMMRHLLVGSAQFILGPFGPDTDLRRFGLALAARGGRSAKKRAAVAVARKLSVLLLRLWESGEAYEPLRNARLRGEAIPASP
ncbi:MAG: IS110 family transposase [Armatimonadetes bacterium]|nr:IS110 family transposase [Armatimonadota bacterium]